MIKDVFFKTLGWILFATFMIWAMLLFTVIAHGQELSHNEYTTVRVVYEVEPEDTLDSIAKVYMKKNTYGARELNEFKSGIEELNPWIAKRGISAKDKLVIQYWKKANIEF